MHTYLQFASWPTKSKMFTLIFRWLSGKESACQCRSRKRCGFDPWVGKIPWRRKWQPTPVFLPGESQEQRNLVGYSPWACKESDTTEHAQTHLFRKCLPILVSGRKTISLYHFNWYRKGIWQNKTSNNDKKKSLRKLGKELQLDKRHGENPTGDIILNKDWRLFPCDGTKQERSLSPLLFKIVLEVLASTPKQGTERYIDWQGRNNYLPKKILRNRQTPRI